MYSKHTNQMSNIPLIITREPTEQSSSGSFSNYWAFPSNMYNDTDTETETNSTESLSDSIYDDIHNIHDDEYELDSEMDVIDTIYFTDRHFLDEPKEHGTHYLGNISCINSQLLMELAVSPSTFFKFTYKKICRYVRSYSISSHWLYPKSQIDIFVLDIHDDCYRCILKTVWLRLIQRHWKKIFQERLKVINLRKQWATQRHFELRGKYPIDACYLPTIHGLMSQYSSDTF
jgi:hypothetical protein